MRKMMLFTTGAAVGYVLGAKAGRPAYDRIVAGWRRTSESVGLPDLSRTVGQSAVDLREAAKDRATTQAHDLVERAADAMSPSTNGNANDRADGASANSEHGAIVAPTPRA